MGPRRTPSVVAWSLWGLWVAVAALTLWLGRGQPVADESGFVIAMVGYATVGALVASRQPGNAVGWLLLAVAFTIVLQDLGEAYVYTESNPGYVCGRLGDRMHVHRLGHAHRRVPPARVPRPGGCSRTNGDPSGG